MGRIEAVVDIVSREADAKILHNLVGVVICSQRMDSMVAMAVDCTGNSEVVKRVGTVIVGDEKIFRGKRSFTAEMQTHVSFVSPIIQF